MSTFHDQLVTLITAEAVRVQDNVDEATEMLEDVVSGLGLLVALNQRGNEARSVKLATELVAAMVDEFPGIVSRRAAAVRDEMLEPAARRH